MDYTRYTAFPFPDRLDAEGRQLKAAFLALPDARQLELLQGCASYREFYARTAQEISAL